MRRRLSRRILIIVQNLPVPFDRRVWLECQALIAAGHGVSVICPKGPADAPYSELEGVRIYRYRPPPVARGILGYLYEFLYCWLASAVLAVRVYWRDGFDAVQACNPPDTYFVLALAFKALGCRFVYDQHDLCPETYLARFDHPSRLLLAGLKLLERGTYLVADHVISTNESYRQVALVRGHRRPEGVTVVRNGPDPAKFRRRVPRPELKRTKKYLACYLGVMGPQDGVGLLLQAVEVLVHQLERRNCHIALLGFGDCYQELRLTATRLGLDEWVTFTGRADDAMLADYLSTADIGLSPDPKNSFNDLSTMNKTMEYMAFELPVVAYDLKETRVSAGDSAVYVRANDIGAYARAIDDLLDAPERRAAMGRAGRKRVEDVLAWQHQVPSYIRVYDTMLGRVRTDRPLANLRRKPEEYQPPS